MEKVKNFKVIQDKNLGEDFWDKRYVVVDTDTGEVIDDAQGYGYRTIKGAYAAYAYKTRTPKQKKDFKERMGTIQKWIDDNKFSLKLLDGLLFDEVKSNPEFKFNVPFIRQMFIDNGYDPQDLPFKLKDFKTFYMKK